MSLMTEWRHAPVRIVDTSTERDHGATVIEIRLYGMTRGQVGDVVARWYPTTVSSARQFLKGFRGEDTWITLEQLEQLLAMEGLERYAQEIRYVLSNQLALTEVKPAARHRARKKPFGAGFWGWFLVSASLAAVATLPLLALLFP